MNGGTFIYRVLPFILMALTNSVLASQLVQGQVIVRMKGSIIDAPCAVELGDQKQSVDFGALTTGELIHDGHGATIPVHIHLKNCTLVSVTPGKKNWSWFTVTLDGIQDNGIFGVVGAKGIGLRISDQAGNIARPGAALPPQRLVNNDLTLNYNMQLVDDGRRLRAGAWHTTIRFKVDYN